MIPSVKWISCIRNDRESMTSPEAPPQRASRPWTAAVRELLMFGVLYGVYTTARGLVRGDRRTALGNGHWVIRLERGAHVAIEAPVQRAMNFQPATWILSNVYLVAQLVVPVLVLMFAYRRAHPVYVTLRNTVIGIWLIVIPVFAAFPVAPPWLTGVGLATVSGHSATADAGHSSIFYNPYAAVPSVHAGMALTISVGLAASLRRRWLQALVLLWTPLVILSVIATGNHYLFDVVTGLLAAVVAYAVGRLVTRPAVAASESPRTAGGLVASDERVPIVSERRHT